MAQILTRIEPIAKDIELILREDLSPKAQSAAFAAFAREQLEDAQEVNRQALGAVPDHETFVDGRKGAPLESVKVPGIIVFEFELLNEPLEWIDAMLVLNSPHRTGRYAKSHRFFADGVEADPDSPPPAEKYVYVNVQPYARKIERGLSKQFPAGVYQVVANMASRRFGNTIKARYGFEAVRGGERNPAIIVTPNR